MSGRASPTLCDPMDRSMPGLPVHHQLPESTQTHVHRVGDAINHLILCRPLLLLPSTFPSIRGFSNESAFRSRWPKYWSFSLNISPSNEYSGLISFRIDWLDLFTVQGTLKSLLQHCSSNQSILKEISPKYSLERLMLKLQYFGHLMQRTDSLEKTPMLGKIEGKRTRG